MQKYHIVPRSTFKSENIQTDSFCQYGNRGNNIRIGPANTTTLSSAQKVAHLKLRLQLMAVTVRSFNFLE